MDENQFPKFSLQFIFKLWKRYSRRSKEQGVQKLFDRNKKYIQVKLEGG